MHVVNHFSQILLIFENVQVDVRLMMKTCTGIYLLSSSKVNALKALVSTLETMHCTTVEH
jgi:hypothetical protein